MILALIGFLSGIISGMGIGGGTILIPSLVIFNNLPQQQAQGVNLVVFLPVSIIALFTHYKNGNIDFSFAKLIIVGGVFGAIIGSLLAVQIEPIKLKKYFGIFLLIVGTYELFSKKK